MSLATAAALAAGSQVYTWEPPDRVIAARYGLDPADILRFDVNTSPVAPDIVAATLGEPFEPPLNEYPDSTYAALAEAAADYVSADPGEILVGCGIDEVLDIVAKATLAPGAAAIVPTPTYSYYGVLTSQRGARSLAVPRRPAEDGFALDVAALEARLPEASLVWLCSPNNPTGAPEAAAAIERLLTAGAELPGGGPLVVVDEAYHEFHPASVVAWRTRFPSLVVTRTLSKAFGLAGARVGYAVAARLTVERLERLRPPGSLSTISAALGTAALRRPELAQANAEALAVEREWLAAAMRDVGCAPYPSVTNFLLCPFGSREAAVSVAEHLLRHGIVPRTFGADSPLADHLRFTVRDRRQDERFIEAIGRWPGRDLP
jgi:histidinol-phosphate aminotransferase